MGDFRTVYLSLVEPITEKDAFTGRQTWHTRRVSVGVIANPGAQFPYVSLDLGDEVGQVVEMSYGEALDLITALTLATREVGATVRQVAAQQREVQS
jgi:hypothetical protein